MRKLSEILRIATQFHVVWNEDAKYDYMCCALEEAAEEDLITSEEATRAQKACMRLVHSIDDICLSLRASLNANFNLNRDNTRNIIYLVYEAWIDKLESQGK